MQLIHVFGKFHIDCHLRNGTGPSQLVTGMLTAQRRAPRGSTGAAPPGSRRLAERPAARPRTAAPLRTSSSDSLCGTEKQLVTSTECLSTVPAGGQRG